MSISPLSSTPPPGPGGAGSDARSPEEAARQFESVLVRQFVEVMTKDLFSGEGEGMMTGQADLQRDTLTDTLAEHLVESGTFGIADLLLDQWTRQGRTLPAAPPETTAPTSSAPIPEPPGRSGGAGRSAPGPLTMDEALRLYPPAKARPLSLDPPPRPSADTQP